MKTEIDIIEIKESRFSGEKDPQSAYWRVIHYYLNSDSGYDILSSATGMGDDMCRLRGEALLPEIGDGVCFTGKDSLTGQTWATVTCWKNQLRDMTVTLPDGSQRHIAPEDIIMFRCKNTGKEYRVGEATKVRTQYTREGLE